MTSQMEDDPALKYRIAWSKLEDEGQQIYPKELFEETTTWLQDSITTEDGISKDAIDAINKKIRLRTLKRVGHPEGSEGSEDSSEYVIPESKNNGKKIKGGDLGRVGPPGDRILLGPNQKIVYMVRMGSVARLSGDSVEASDNIFPWLDSNPWGYRQAMFIVRLQRLKSDDIVDNERVQKIKTGYEKTLKLDGFENLSNGLIKNIVDGLKKPVTNIVCFGLGELDYKGVDEDYVRNRLVAVHQHDFVIRLRKELEGKFKSRIVIIFQDPAYTMNSKTFLVGTTLEDNKNKNIEVVDDPEGFAKINANSLVFWRGLESSVSMPQIMMDFARKESSRPAAMICDPITVQGYYDTTKDEGRGMSGFEWRLKSIPLLEELYDQEQVSCEIEGSCLKWKYKDEFSDSEREVIEKAKNRQVDIGKFGKVQVLKCKAVYS